MQERAVSFSFLLYFNVLYIPLFRSLVNEDKTIDSLRCNFTDQQEIVHAAHVHCHILIECLSNVAC